MRERNSDENQEIWNLGQKNIRYKNGTTTDYCSNQLLLLIRWNTRFYTQTNKTAKKTAWKSTKNKGQHPKKGIPGTFVAKKTYEYIIKSSHKNGPHEPLPLVQSAMHLFLAGCNPGTPAFVYSWRSTVFCRSLASQKSFHPMPPIRMPRRTGRPLHPPHPTPRHTLVHT